MLVKAKWNVRDAAGWHKPGDVFETDADFGDKVEILIPDAGKQQPPKASKPESKPEAEKAEKPEPVKEEPPKPKTTTRRKVSK